MADPLNEFLQFLKPDARIDLKDVALDHLLGISATNEGIETLVKNTEVIESVLKLMEDKSDNISKSALFFFVNITASECGAKEFLKYKNSDGKSILDTFVGYVLDSEKMYADAACMVLSNVTRLDDELDSSIDVLLPRLDALLDVFVKTEYNKKDSKLHYLAPFFSNISRSHRVRKWLTNTSILFKLLPFCNYDASNIRKGGAIGTVRNLSFATELHEFLLNPELELLTYLLNPLMGAEEYDDDEMEKLPLDLQYLPKEKMRDSDADIRKMILEILNRFCTKQVCREILRDNGVYYVLREYHKWEKEPAILLACENVVDILIRKEDEIGVDDITTIDVPEDMREKFLKMDDEFVNNYNN